MAADKRTVSGSLSWLKWWAWPFVWILISPAVTMPVQVWLLGNSGDWPSASVYENCELIHGRVLEPGVFVDNRWRCGADDVVQTLLPGLLNLGPLLWLGLPGRTRLAALVAGGLGAARLAVPALTYVALGTVDLRTTFWPGPDETVIASVALWAASAVAFILFPRAVRTPRLLP